MTERLVDTPLYLRLGPELHGGGGGAPMVFSTAIPADPSLCGLPWAAQAIVFGGFTDLSSAAEGVIGY